MNPTDLYNLDPVPQSFCSEGCAGHRQARCGFHKQYFSAFVTSCDSGWTRFGDSCYKEATDGRSEYTLQNNENSCTDQDADSHIWWPESIPELEFIMVNYKGMSHVGWKSFSHQNGTLNSDGSHSPGSVDVITLFANQSISDSDDLMSDTNCAILDAHLRIIKTVVPCPLAKGICKKHICMYHLIVLK
jgi:hypothetical protein